MGLFAPPAENRSKPQFIKAIIPSSSLALGHPELPMTSLQQRLLKTGGR